jgi:hypothetical protein
VQEIIVKAGDKQSPDTLLRLSSDPDVGGEMFFRNAGSLTTDDTALYLRRWNSS